MRNRNELHPLIYHLAQGLERKLTMCIIRHDLHYRPRLFADLQESDIVAGILCHRRQDAVPGLEGNRVERHVPRARGVFNHGDLFTSTIDQCSGRVIHPLDGMFSLFRCLVTPNLCLKLQVPNRCTEHRFRHQ